MRVILICPESGLRGQLETALSAQADINIIKSLAEVPTSDTLRSILLTWTPGVLFLDIRHPRSDEMNRLLADEFPQIRRVAVEETQSTSAYRKVLNWGMHELIAAPFAAAELETALNRISVQVETVLETTRQASKLIAFTPAKAGVGASTLAANAAWSWSASADTRLLLADFDIHSGVIGFLYGAEHEYSVTDALACGTYMDKDSWRRLVKPSGKIDLLLSNPGRVTPGDDSRNVRSLVQFVRETYPVALADVPDTWSAVGSAILQEADQIMLVTTPELPSLRMARLKAALLEKLELNTKTVLVVNRFRPHCELSIAEIEKMVGLEAISSFPCNYEGVTKAIRDAKPAECLAEEMTAFHGKLFNRAAPRKDKRATFLEKFSLLPARFGIRGHSGSAA